MSRTKVITKKLGPNTFLPKKKSLSTTSTTLENDNSLSTEKDVVILDKFDCLPDVSTDTACDKVLEEEEEKARCANDRAELQRHKALAGKRKALRNENKAEREIKAKQLDDLLTNCARFSDILTKKTKVLGRAGCGLDGKILGEHNLEMATQPKCMIGGQMRDYQLEGLTWMFEICLQGMSGILADEMGLGKTIQTISLFAKFREEANYMGPHLVVAPLSTLSNWQEEFKKWVPSVPVAFYHGVPSQRKEIFQKKLQKNFVGGRANEKFPVVLTTPEIVIRDASDLSRINWEIIIIDEGHRLKNSDSKLFRILRNFTSVTRFLITGTPLQNNLKELWSLLNFILPNIFANWEQFESWFDFSDLQDEEGTEEFIQDQMKQDLVRKIHLILQPLLLRRIKADVEHLLPRKREYILYAPMTKQQIELYNVISNKSTDTREYLESKVIERLEKHHRKSTPVRETGNTTPKVVIATKRNNASAETLVEKGGETSEPIYKKGTIQHMLSGMKRKAQESISIPAKRVAKSDPSPSPAFSKRVQRTRKKVEYVEAPMSEEESLSDDEFEAKLAQEMSMADKPSTIKENTEATERSKTTEIAKREIAIKKLGNPLMQLRLTCNSPHNFYKAWNTDEEKDIDETIVNSSGKMLLLDRLLPELFKRGSKVLVFSQFKTQLDILEDYAQYLRNWKLCRIDGSVAQEDRQQQINLFNNDPEYKLFLLSTHAGGQGINLTSADTVILYDSDWNPQQDLQAQDRVHRIGQKKPVIIYRLATRGTVEEALLLSADAKRRLEKLVIKKRGLVNMSTKSDADERLSSAEMKALLLKDGQAYQYHGGEQILSEADLAILCDRSESAYSRAEEGHDSSKGFMVVATRASGIISIVEQNKLSK
ncbi:transcription factor [Blumeria hordei DH14]|uniref:Transcription factor n=1 Tax=Blumeria graminis f. sp. hordei (strain DH14) TaxID=546991 RepID=N1J5R3_BLUG1|nr:transcription factor [Blumeria hordei DH14]